MKNWLEFFLLLGRVAHHIRETGAPNSTTEDRTWVLELDNSCEDGNTQCLNQDDMNRLERIAKENEIS